MLALLCALAPSTVAQGQGTQTEAVEAANDCSQRTLRKGISFYRQATWKFQDDRLARHSSTSFRERRTRSCSFLDWLADFWRENARAERRIADRYGPPPAAIRYVFGGYAEQALAVAYCETGGSYWPGSSNGQYLGIFQMGSSERSRYGHSRTALGQAVAAWRYFVASGRDWSPWECQP